MEVSPLEPTNNDNKHHETSKSILVVDENATSEAPDESDAQEGAGDGSMAQLQSEHDEQNNKNKDDNSNSEDSDDEDNATFISQHNKNNGENSFNDSEKPSGNLEESTSTTAQQNGTTTATDSTTNMDDMDVDDADDANEKGESVEEDAEMSEAVKDVGGGVDQSEAMTDDSQSINPAPSVPSAVSEIVIEPSESTAAVAENDQSTQASSAPAEVSSGPSGATTNGATATDAKLADVPVAQLPVMKGTLCYEEDTRRHLIRGMWNYENSTAFPPQRFELVRTLAPEEDLKKLPQDGEFHGSFSLMYTHITSKGKKKERSKVIAETGVKITFSKQDDGSFVVDGKGTNQFGVFLIQGTAKPNKSPVLDDHTYSVEMRKRYEEVPVPADVPAVVDGGPTAPVGDNVDEPLPPPSQSFPTGVICLKGNLVKEESVETLGVSEVVHKISGMWAAGLNFLTDGGPTNRFEYEHKSSSSANNVFPVSGRYSGWFDLTNEDGTRTRINERDVTLKFRRNSADGYNIDGRGTNVFGKYNITGTLSAEPDNVLTIFRHFQPRKIKTKAPGVVTAAPASGAQPAAQRRPSITQSFDPILSLDDVEPPQEAKNGSNLEPIVPPINGTYSAVSRGVLRVNDDGTHTCSGKWAATREHFTNGQTSAFNFRLESHFAQAATSVSGDIRAFPLDSDRYKGSFQLKKQGSRYQTIIDQQVVMKFRLNSQGSYNVYGKGVNPIGQFDLVGTLVMSGKTGGQVELYRMYPQKAPAAPVQGSASVTAPLAGHIAKPEAALVRQPSTASLANAQRRESTRLVKLPSKLEDDDPDALLSRTMSKCAQILRAVREKDNEMGNFFAEPVDPVALGIPSYHQIIKEPMDLKTIHRRLETSAVTDPDEFARLVRLVFQNAMTFNVDPAHSVHQSARHLLVFFNQRFREVERIMVKLADEEKAKKGKDDKKRKREGEPPKSLKRIRLEEAQALASANAHFFADIVSNVPADSATVSRTEFNMLLGHIQQLSKQLVDTHQLLAELSPGDDQDLVYPITSIPATVPSASASVASSIPERKKAPKRKSEIAASGDIVPRDDAKPLTLAEQELLTEFFEAKIDTLSADDLNTVVQIVRSAAPVGTDENEIDLEIELLDAPAQRKLLRIVMKYVKKSAVKPKKKPKITKPTPSATASAAPKKTTATAVVKPKTDTGSFFAFGSKGDDSDSDSGDDDDKSAPAAGQFGGKQFSNNSAKEFRLGDSFGDFGDDNDEVDDDVENGGFAAKWSMPNPSSNQGDEQEEDDNDDAWGEARQHAAVVKQQEADRKAREEKLQAEAEAAKAQRLKDAAARGEEIKAQRAEEVEKEALLKEQQQKELDAARLRAKAEAKAQNSIQQTIDLDADRDLMKQYEQSVFDKDGSASPSSDFGF